MSISGVLSGPLFIQSPLSILSSSDSRQSDATKRVESVVKFEELTTDSKHSSLKLRVVGITLESHLHDCKMADGNYRITRTLTDRFQKPAGIKNLPKDFVN